MILNRQLRALLKRLGLEESKAPSTTQWVSLLSYLNDHFRVNEDEKHRLNRSLEIHGREIQSLYKELVLERERLSSAIGCLQIGFVIFDKSGHVSLMNAEAEQYLGWAEFEASSRDLVLELGLNDFVDRPLSALLGTGQSLNGNFGLQTRSGELYHTNLQLQPIIRDGVLVGSVLTFDTEESSTALQQRLDRDTISETLQDFIERLSMWLETDADEVISRHLSSLLHRTEEVLGVASRRQENEGVELAGQRESRALTSGERTQEEQPAVREAPLELAMSELPAATKVIPVVKVKPPSTTMSTAFKASVFERTAPSDSSTPAKVAPERIISINPPAAAKQPAAVAPQVAVEARVAKESEALLSEIPVLFTSEEMERYDEPTAPAKPAPEVAAPLRVAPPLMTAVKPPVIAPPSVAASQSAHSPMPPLSELTAQTQTPRPAPLPLGNTLSDNRPKTPSKDLPLRVLLVEDEPVSQLVTQSQLGQLGHECTVASDSHEAIRLYQHQPFDAVISSYLMPGMNGIELCRKIRDDARGGYTYFILLTAVERKDEAAKALEAGVDAFLTKPLDPNELAIRLKVARGVQSRLNRVYSELPDQRG